MVKVGQRPQFDVVIVGAGLAGSIAATMLARAGHSVCIVDPNKVYPDDFRVEKLDGEQSGVLAKTGLLDAVLAASTHDREVWVARLGHLAEKRKSDQQGFDYGHLVNTLRAEMPTAVTFIHGKVTGVANSDELQTVALAMGEPIVARLVILANGLNNGLRQSLGMERVDQSRCHSITFGFDMEPAEGTSFPFRALTYYGEHPRYRTAYITLFPIGERMRANYFVYRDLDDPCLREFRATPEAHLKAAMPRLERLTGPIRVKGPIKVRPVDLYETDGYLKPGVVLIGDAFATSCPAAGTGARKALVDVERLCNHHVSRWLATPGMGAEKIATFYDDPVKMESDEKSCNLAYFIKSITLEEGLAWWMWRWVWLAGARLRWTLTALKAHLENAVPGVRAKLGKPAPVFDDGGSETKRLDAFAARR